MTPKYCLFSVKKYPKNVKNDCFVKNFFTNYSYITINQKITFVKKIGVEKTIYNYMNLLYLLIISLQNIIYKYNTLSIKELKCKKM